MCSSYSFSDTGTEVVDSPTFPKVRKDGEITSSLTILLIFAAVFGFSFRTRGSGGHWRGRISAMYQPEVTRVRKCRIAKVLLRFIGEDPVELLLPAVFEKLKERFFNTCTLLKFITMLQKRVTEDRREN